MTAYAYDDLDVVTESLRLGWVNFLAAGGERSVWAAGAGGGLAQGNRLWHVAATLRLAQAENLLRGGQLAEAAAIVEEMGRRLGEMRSARLGMQQLFLQAVVQVGRGAGRPGECVAEPGADGAAGGVAAEFSDRAGDASCTTRAR